MANISKEFLGPPETGVDKGAYNHFYTGCELEAGFHDGQDIVTEHTEDLNINKKVLHSPNSINYWGRRNLVLFIAIKFTKTLLMSFFALFSCNVC